jgi:plastocyanin
MRRIVLLLALTLLALPACGGGSGSSEGATRTVLTDFNYDEIAASYYGYFPQYVTVHPGDTIDFKQAWTGEPHTVTMGQIAQPLGNAMAGYFDGTKAVPDDEPEDVKAASKDIPQFFNDTGALGQTAAQPCFLDTGPLPDGAACPQRKVQPEFNGRQAFYNSGFIPYEGNNGNHFRMKLAKDTPEGNYFYFCLIHGSLMGGYLQVRPASVRVPTQNQLNRTARTELNAVTKRLTIAHKAALKPKEKRPGVDIEAGTAPEDPAFPFSISLEYYPSTFRAKVGSKVNWSLNGHTVSFNVPKYGPQIIVEKNGEVKLNPKAYDAVNSPKPPESTHSDAGPNSPPPPPVQLDAGNYNGSKFISSGAQDNTQFSLTFTKAGTYRYACLIHPRMIGTVVVTK